MGATPVTVSQNNNGIEKSWFFTSTAAAGAAYGLIGALVTVAMDAIINAGPSRRAQKAADEMAELMSVDTLNASLAEKIRQHVPAEAPGPGVTFSGVQSVQRLGVSTVDNDVVDISVSYTLSEDSSTLRVIAAASYQNTATPYAPPYQFKGAVPKTETRGPAYRNWFTYYSAQLPVPTLTPELRERLIASIQDSARDESGALPAEGADGFKSMSKELENARDDKLTKDEIAIFLTREWLREDGALLRKEVEQAHEFVARYVLADLNRPVAPSIAGQDELLETMADERTVRRIGTGRDAGSYVSSAGGVASFSTYGNAIGIAHANQARIKTVREAARATAAR